MATERVFARSSAKADLPDAVGPAMRIAVSVLEPVMPDLRATLISPADGPPLSSKLVSRLESTVNGRAHRLAPHVLRLEGLSGEAKTGETKTQEAKRWDAQLHAIVDDTPCDILIIRADVTFKLFLADMDSTMIEQECIDELADLAGFGAKVAAITERAMRGELDFATSLRERVALLKGLPLTVIDEVLQDRITLTPGAADLLAFLREKDIHTCLVSGGFTRFTGPVAAKLGFDEHHANTLLSEQGAMTGAVQEPILGREAKRDTLCALRTKLALSPEQVIAIGDGANDLAMIQEAGFGIAYRAKPALNEAADARIRLGDLSALKWALT
jgi:phosphoserine phosphatase